MKCKRHTPQQVVCKLQEVQSALAPGREFSAVCQMLGISVPDHVCRAKMYCFSR